MSKILSYYAREEIQSLIIDSAEDKEIAVMFEKGFGKRPDILVYENEILELAKKKLISLHCSEELWTNPLNIKTGMSRKQLDELRIGWDLVIDIDCPYFEYSKLTAHLIVKALKYCNVKNIGVKFSGNKGFHIGVPWESFPKKINNELTKNLFPEAAKKIAEYIKFLIEKPLKKNILTNEGNDLHKISQKVNLPKDKINKGTQLNPELNLDTFIEMDTLLISSRHLYRMPYSYHEKSNLISLPINPDKILDFKKEMANPETAEIGKLFFNRNKYKNDAEELLTRSLDFTKQININKPVEKKTTKKYIIPKDAIKEEFFPPCIFNIKKGIKDGKKRMLFVLLNFLSSLGWNKEQIEDYVENWNNNNKDKLDTNYITTQSQYTFKRKEKILPPNCSNQSYYKDCNVCTPDLLCQKIKNPVQYSKIKQELSEKKKKQKKKQKPKSKND